MKYLNNFYHKHKMLVQAVGLVATLTAVTLIDGCASTQPQMYQSPVYTAPKPVEKECGWKENRTNDGYCISDRENFILRDIVSPLKYGASEVTEDGRVVQKTGFACLMDQHAKEICAEARREADANGDKTITYQEALDLKDRIIEYLRPSKPFYFEEERSMQNGEYSEKTTRISEDKVQEAINTYKETAEAALSACQNIIKSLPNREIICPGSLTNCNYFSGGKKALDRDYNKIPAGRKKEIKKLHDGLEPLLKKAELLLEEDLEMKCGYTLDCGDLK